MGYSWKGQSVHWAKGILSPPSKSTSRAHALLFSGHTNKIKHCTLPNFAARMSLKVEGTVSILMPYTGMSRSFTEGFEKERAQKYRLYKCTSLLPKSPWWADMSRICSWSVAKVLLSKKEIAGCSPRISRCNRSGKTKMKTSAKHKTCCVILTAKTHNTRTHTHAHTRTTRLASIHWSACKHGKHKIFLRLVHQKRQERQIAPQHWLLVWTVNKVKATRSRSALNKTTSVENTQSGRISIAKLVAQTVSWRSTGQCWTKAQRRPSRPANSVSPTCSSLSGRIT